MAVALVASLVHCFPAQVSSSIPGTVSFNATSADFVAVVVCWESYTDPAPAVLYNGQVGKLVTTPQLNVGSPGAVALYAFEIAVPDSDPHDLVVSPTPNYCGWTSVFAASYSGSNLRFGQMVTDEYGTHASPVLSGETTVSGILSGSVVVFGGFTTFGDEPTTMTIDSAGWTELGRDNDTNITALAVRRDGTASGSATIELSDATAFFNLHCFAYEVTQTGTAIPTADVTVTASHVERLDRPGADTASFAFDVNGGDVLIAVIMRSNSSGDTVTDAVVGPTTYGGVPLRFLSQFHERNTTISAQFSTAILMNPPTGAQTFSTEGFTGNVGYVNVALVALSGGSGVIGVRHVSSQQGNALDCELDDSVAGSLMLAIQVASHTYNSTVASYGWDQIEFVNEPGTNGEDPPTQLATWVFTGVGAPGFSLVLTPAAFTSSLTLVMEWVADRAGAADYEGVGAITEDALEQAGTAVFETAPTPAGQQFHAYHDMWQESPPKAAELLQPDDFYLANLPAFIDAVVLSFAKTQPTYVDLTSDVRTTMGMEWPGSATLLKETIALLKSRNPSTRVFLGIQQYNIDFLQNTPYNAGGWGGMTEAHFTSHAAFCTDMDIDGIVLDYEVYAPGTPPYDALEYHCWTENGERHCYTDTEMLDVITSFRAHFPRPFELFLDGQHVGAYGEGGYTNAPPGLGYNSGINLCVARDAGALAALDGIHVMSYDVGDGYDPRQAVRAYQDNFPGVPIYMGLRVGPPDYQGVKITAAEFKDFANTCIKLGLAGGHMYSTLWDQIVVNPNDDPNLPPFGDYNMTFPDGNIAGAVFARAFGLSYGSKPRMTNAKLARGVVRL